MKRKMIITTLLVLVIGTGEGVAQKGITLNVSYASNQSVSSLANKDIREFHEFQKDVEYFSIAVNRNKFQKAKRIKTQLLRSIRSEIGDTQQKIRFIERDIDYSYSSRQRKVRGKSNLYSKRNVPVKTNYIIQLEKQLRIQTQLFNKLNLMSLNRGRVFYMQGRNHEILFQDFNSTMKSDISLSFKEYRNLRKL